MNQVAPVLRIHPSDPQLSELFSHELWHKLDELLAQLPFARQFHGDIADHHLEVAMIITNRGRPHPQPGIAADLIALLGNPTMIRFFRSCAQRLLRPVQDLVIRRMQVNRMQRGDHNHHHRDTDDDPDYVIGAILYLTSAHEYEGGEIEFDGIDEPIKPQRHEVVVFAADLGHKLRALTDCQRPRLSIVMLFGTHDGPNLRHLGDYCANM